MSAAFTHPDDWTSAVDRTAANEIVLAYSERRQAIGQSAVSALAAGANAQDTDFWRGIQEWIEANLASWCDHVNGPLNGAGTEVLAFTSATFRAAAGLNASGFRRSTDGSTFAYGTIQSGDVRGPWIFEDLQKAFSVLLWTKATGIWNVSAKKRGEYYFKEDVPGTMPNWATIKANTESDWGDFDEDPVLSLRGYTTAAATKDDGDDVIQTRAERVSGSPAINPWSGVDRSVDFYVAGSIPTGFGWVVPDEDWTYDDNGAEVDEGPGLTLISTVAASQSALVGDAIGDSSVPTWCDEPPSFNYEYIGRGWKTDGLPRAVVKWDFTNANE